MAEIDWEADSVIADGDKELSRGPCKVRLYTKKKKSIRRCSRFVEDEEFFFFSGVVLG
jgi:hypothetical protein